MLNIPSYDWGNVESPWIGVKMDVWDALLKGRAPQVYPPRSTVFWQDKEFSHIYIVARGRVCISIFHADGQQKQLYIACPGAMIGDTDCILSQPYSTTATTITKSELYAIPSKEVQRMFHSEPGLADLMLQYQARKNRLFIAQAAMLSFDRAEQRIAKTLLYLCEAYGRPAEGGTCIHIRFTCAELAAIVNTSRVTVNNVMLDLIRNGVLAKDGGYYIVRQPQALQATAVQMINV